MRLRVFASGSKGNALAVRSARGQLLLVDLGLSHRELKARAEVCCVDVGKAGGVLFTHDHVDHFTGVAQFHKHYPDVPLFANGGTADAIAAKSGVSDGWAVFETACEFEIGDFRVTPFSISHDAADPVGYLIEDGASALFIGTDTGVVTTGVRDAFGRCDCAVLESNHDPVLLQTSNRSPALKQRIAGRSGHLANEDAAALFREVNPSRLKALLLAHLSEECNTPSLARAAMKQALADCGRSDVQLAILEQYAPSDLVEIP